MRIEELDRNMAVETSITEPDLIWVDARTAPFSLHGVFYDEAQGCFVRMPQPVADAVNERVARMNHLTSGGRLRFRTDSAYIGLRAVQPETQRVHNMPPSGQSGLDLYRLEEGVQRFSHIFAAPVLADGGITSGYTRQGEMTDFTIDFPLYDGVQALYIGLKKGSRLEAPTPYTHQKPVVYYGSSITHGACASRPGNLYQGFISRWLDTDYINLGFSGACWGEKRMAEYIATLEMSAFVFDYDHNCDYNRNVLGSEHLRATHLPFYRIFREKQPDTPILFVSAPSVHQWRGDFYTRREIIMENYERAKAEGDKNVYFIDGATLCGEDWDACSVDRTHPNDLGFYFMAKKISAVLEPLLGR